MINKKVLQGLNKVKSELKALDSGNYKSAQNIDSILKRVVAGIPEGMTELADIMNLGCAGLQAVYQGETSAPQPIIDAIIQAVDSAEQYLAGGPDKEIMLNQAGRMLWAASGKDLDQSPYRGDENKSSDDQISLDDIAALFMQVKSGDIQVGELQQAIRSSLIRLSASPAQPYLAKALDEVDKIISGPAPDIFGILDGVGQFIEFAIIANNDNGLLNKHLLSTLEDAKKTLPGAVSADESRQESGQPKNEQSDGFTLNIDKALIGDFIAECSDYIGKAEAALLELEADSENSELINTVFRAFHTIKGTSSLLNFNIISEMTHLSESLLSRIRSKEINYSGVYADLTLRSLDMTKELLRSLEKVGADGNITKPAGYDELIKQLENPEGMDKDIPENENTVKGNDPEINKNVVSSITNASGLQEILPSRGSLKDINQGAESSVRIRTDRLDRLIDTVGELVIAESLVAQDELVVSNSHYEFSKKVIRLGKIVRELQDLSMFMRMVPFKSTFQKMARLARDLSRNNGKLVRFITEGEDTEIDRNMIEIISEPLIHLIRNAVDHGIESPDVRKNSGKPEMGTILLKAYHSGGNVIIEIHDDGKGLDRNKIIQKAISKGLIDPDNNMSDQDVFILIFEAGFSTVDKITDLSGRGVGMDVVKKGVESLSGSIDISSRPNQGCTFSIRLPLTLAITDGMLVKVGQEYYIIPTINSQAIFRPTEEMLSSVFERGEMVDFRGNLIPLFRLHRLFDIPGAVEDPTMGLLLVIGSGSSRCAVLVDELLNKQQVVLKSLGEGIGKLKGISGGAILGDGHVGLMLDAGEICSLARQINTSGGRLKPALVESI